MMDIFSTVIDFILDPPPAPSLKSVNLAFIGLALLAKLAIPFAVAGVKSLLSRGKNKGGGGGGGDFNDPLTARASSPLIRSLLEGQNKAQEFGMSEAQKSLQGSRSSIAPVTSLFTRLLSGDRSAVAQAIGPQAGTVIGQFESARKAASQNAPRGGGRNQMLGQVPFQKAGAVSDLVQKTIPAAAEGLLQAGQVQGSIGSQLLGTASRTGIGSLNALIAGRSISLEEQKRKDKNLGALAKGVADVISVLIGKWKDKDKDDGGGISFGGFGGGSSSSGSGWNTSSGAGTKFGGSGT